MDCIDKLSEKIEKKSYKELSIFLEDENFYELNKDLIRELVPNENIYDDRDIQLMTDYFYYPIYTGYYEDYNAYNTTGGIWTRYAEYIKVNIGTIYVYGTMSNTEEFTYVWIGVYYGLNVYQVYEHHYTGAVKYILNSRFFTANHVQTITFTYQSTSNVFDQWTSPDATFVLIYDYLGREKLILSSNEIGTSFKISKSAHYNRNDFNIDPATGENVAVKYDTLVKLGTQFGDALGVASSYYHRLLSSNADNLKFVENIRYYDVILDTEIDGSLELVYCRDIYDVDGDGNISEYIVENEDLVTYTFNFATYDSYNEPENFLFWDAVSDGHWIRDVYPYLIWGNTPQDYIDHTAYERFVWDKDASMNAESGNYIGQNYSGTTLIDLYENGDISNAGGDDIPFQIVNGEIYFDDVTPPTFDYIATQTITNNHANRDWTYLITNAQDNYGGVLTFFEIYDNVIYSIPGTYTVKVGVSDEAGNQKTQIFTVHVILPSC
ncbi:MAG: DUF5011 domain-containing protein [Acholeplasmataceae bacterium]|nr:DUF5011 domain-containing protein [Acholeplasmataceae bacterium]